MTKYTNIIKYQPTEDTEFFFDEHEIIVREKEYIFSVVTACYNCENYVKDTIDSIINQSFGFDKIQLILVDDGSTDNTPEILDEYASEFRDNIIVIHKENGGVSAARNVGMKYTTGKYINFIDSDDYFQNNVFEKVYKFFQENESKIDVITIKNELFGLKSGGAWFNKKFEKGDRVINLWKEPKIYLNAVNCSFFHCRIKNQLYFDENLSISEDLKVVNSVLMNKWAIGVLDSCKYFYRIKSAEEGSLANSARKKECWYFTYLDRVFFWLMEKACKQCHFIPEFIQHTLMRDLFNRFNDNKECEQVLKSAQKIQLYKEKLFKALSLIDDKIIQSSDYINSDYQIYFFTKKYGQPVLIQNDNKVRFVWKNQNISVDKQLCVVWEKCYTKDRSLYLEGYAICNNFSLNSGKFNLRFIYNNKIINPKIIEGTDKNNKLAFADEYIFYRKYFVLEIKGISKLDTPLLASFEILKTNYPISYNSYGKWFGVSGDIKNSYYYNEGICLYVKDKELIIKRVSKIQSKKLEKKYLRTLKDIGKSNAEYLKAYKVRKAYNILSKIFHKPVWIISDRNNCAGDNGEVFYEYVKKKRSINSYFAIRKGLEYNRLKKKGFKVLDIDSIKYKLMWVCSSVIISAYLDKVEYEPISFKFIRDIVAKKKIVFLQHGITKDDLSSIFSRKIQNLDMFVTATNSEYNSIKNNPNYFCDENVVKLLGFPRYDRLYDNPEKIILLMPTWRNELVVYKEGHTTIVDNFKDSYFYKFYYDLLTSERLQNLIKKNGYKICFFIHTNLLEANKYFEDIDNVIIPDKESRDYNKAFATGSIMVTDYSSTAFDFAYLRKPIVYCQGDKDKFFSNHTYSKGYFDYEKDGFGDVVYNINDTVNVIEKLVKNNCELSKQYLNRIEKTFPFKDKRNCERVFKEIKKL